MSLLGGATVRGDGGVMLPVDQIKAAAGVVHQWRGVSGLSKACLHQCVETSIERLTNLGSTSNGNSGGSSNSDGGGGGSKILNWYTYRFPNYGDFFIKSHRLKNSTGDGVVECAGTSVSSLSKSLIYDEYMKYNNTSDDGELTITTATGGSGTTTAISSPAKKTIVQSSGQSLVQVKISSLQYTTNSVR